MRIPSVEFVPLANCASWLGLMQPMRNGSGHLVGTIELASMSKSEWRLPTDKVQAAFDSALMLERNHADRTRARLATGVGWVDLLRSLALPRNKDVLVGLPSKRSKVIGFAVALAGNEDKQYAERSREAARHLHGSNSEVQRTLPGDEIDQREALGLFTLDAQEP